MLEIVQHIHNYHFKKTLCRRAMKTYTSELQQHKLYVVVSCDTELDPPRSGEAWTSRGADAFTEGLPKLVELCERSHLKATFFVEAAVALKFPDTVKQLARTGHEVGCHGKNHEWYGTHPPPNWVSQRNQLKLLTNDEKKTCIFEATETLKRTIGVKANVFKAPFNSIEDVTTLKILEDLGYVTDSSLPNFSGAGLPTETNTGSPWQHRIPFHPCKPSGVLLEIPYSINPDPRFWHPFGSHEDLMSAENYEVFSNAVTLTCCLDKMYGRNESIIFLTSHPYEFSEKRILPCGLIGKKKIELFERALEFLTTSHNSQFLTVGNLRAVWEREHCEIHGGTHV
jgi:peptidoglycan/xylan/chitin deacetylase (PgdA/CDA1 family)